MKDTFKTIEKPTTGEFKDKGSKFLAYTRPISIEADFPLFLEHIKKEHPKARHYCFAWRLGMDKNCYRANDDGEPSGTAGRPILGQIDSFNLTNVGVVVVRYFGGTLLGTSGLIAAYKEATIEALKAATIVEKIVKNTYTLEFGYEKMSDVMNAIKRFNINILKQNFEESGTLIIAIRQSEAEQRLIEIRAAIMKISLEEAKMRENTEGVTIRESSL
ncbi:MAG: YigZ family protein [Saprospiraceae bacterium]|nr:YigZ family protein [Saprospiraceae bacterium]